jgi:ABC-type branched-subunit amino acid transport system ATPase component
VIALDHVTEGADAVLEVRDVALAFGGTKALNGASMAFRHNRTTGLIGPNGAGKSTLINVITAFQAPDHGSVLYQGKEIIGSTPDKLSRQGLLRTFQQPRIFPALSVLENVLVANRTGTDSSLWGALTRIPMMAKEKTAVAAAWETLEQFDLAHLANHPGGQISGGQQRLLELARISQQHPRVLLLDEPTAGVSPLLRPVMVDHIRRLRLQTGCTVVIVEHNMAVIEALCDDVLVMAQGALLTSGTMAQIREHPEVLDAYLGSSTTAHGQLGGGTPRRAK